MKIERRGRLVLVTAAVALTLAGVAGTVVAGAKSEANVSITVGASSTTVVGSVGTARNSADTVQMIKCTTKGFTSSNSVSCQARTAAGAFYSCTANSANLAAATAAINPGSRLYIVGTNAGSCTQLDVTNGSEWQPAVP